jgi:hypothetical protein
MLTAYTKPGINMRKLLYLLFILFVVCIQANALTFTNNIFSENPVSFQSRDLTNTSNPASSDVSLGQSAKLIPPSITLTGIPYESRIAQLSWTTSDPSAVGIYYVERDTSSSGLWIILAQLPYNATLQYDDTISYPYCSITNFSYRIRFEVTATSETGISNIVPLVLLDLTPPANVNNLIVSITSTMFPIVTWDKVTGDDISMYEINRFNGFSWSFNSNSPTDSTSYMDKTVNNVCDTSYAYAIVTIDRCGLRSTPDYAELGWIPDLQNG